MATVFEQKNNVNVMNLLDEAGLSTVDFYLQIRDEIINKQRQDL